MYVFVTLWDSKMILCTNSQTACSMQKVYSVCNTGREIVQLSTKWIWLEELNWKGTESRCMSTSTWVLLLLCTYLFSGCSTKNYLCYAYDQVRFYNWWVSEETQWHHLVLLGLVLVSLCALLPLFSLNWLWHRATLRSSRAIKPLTSMLCPESGLIQRFFLFGRSSSEPEELPSCHSDTAVSDRLLWGHICNGHTCKVLVLVWLTDASWLPQSILAL